MDTIVTPVTVITLDSTRIVHSIKADLVARYFPPVVRLVQYDQSLPVIAVSLMQNGQTYTLPSGSAANIRVHKPDATYVYNPALGCDSTRNIVYFEVTQAMAAANGDGLAIVEIVVDGDIAGTSLITLHFEENPVPEDAIESSDEWETIYELGERIIASTVTPVSTAAGMTDHNVVYLYTGTESGWNQGHMYYYNGTTWVDAGIAVTDTTLSVAGLAADAKATGDAIEDLKDGLTAVENDLYETVNESYALNIQTGAYLATTKEYWSNSGYRCAIIEATSSDTIYISTRTSAANTIPVALFYNGVPSASTYIGLWGEYTQETVLTNVLLPIPDGTTHIVLNCRGYSNPFTAYRSYTVINSKIRNGEISASYANDTLTLKTWYTDTEMLLIQIGKGGGNNLVDFRRIAGISAADGSTVFEYIQNTDWFGPYMVRAVANADGDLPDNWYAHFTGGNHQYNNSGSGSTPTARCVIDKVLFDGKTATSEDTYCSVVEMWWTNYVQGQNTKKADGTGREILKENFYLRFDGNNFAVEHSFTPLENVSIRRYYGLQANWNSTLAPQYNFIGGTSRALKTLSSTEANSGDRNCYDFYIVDNLSNRILFHLGHTDLGAMNKNSDAYSAFQSYSKVYFNLINGNDWQNFSANDMYFYTGNIKISREY